MNRENYSSGIGAALGVSASSPIVSAGKHHASGSDEGFQKLLLRIAASAGARSDSDSLIQLFCRATREFFRVSGVYFWRCQAAEDLVGEQADGKMAERFVGIRLHPNESAVTAEAVRQRRTIFANRVRSKNFPAAMEFEARSLLAAPLVVFKDVIGAVTFLHDSEDNFLMKTWLRKPRFSQPNSEPCWKPPGWEKFLVKSIVERRFWLMWRTPSTPHRMSAAVIEALADRLRLLLRTRLVCVLLRREGPFELKAVSAETPQLATSARARHDRQTLRFAADLAQRAVSAGEPITLSIGAEVHSLGNLVSAGMMIAAPFRTARTQGAILHYPRQEGNFTAEERALVSGHHRIWSRRGRARRVICHRRTRKRMSLHQLLEISSELSARAGSGTFPSGICDPWRRVPRVRQVLHCSTGR